MDLNLRGKVAVVTGGTGGIGAAVMKALRDEGAHPVSVSNTEPTERVPGAEYINGDITDRGAVLGAVSEIKESMGKVDILVNAAGIEEYAPVHLTDEAMFRRVMDVNVTGAFLMIREVLPLMEQGVIINVASVQSFSATRNAAAYVTSKHALLGLTRSVALDYGPRIRCLAVCPGTVDTPLVRKAAVLEVGNSEDRVAEKISEWGRAHLTGRIGRPEEVGKVIAFLCSDAASFMTGSAVMVDGGLLSYIPISTPEVR
ncbi:dihydroanticapsin 7-dehydrogenase [Thermogymnomonas acidicola]|uniref:Dihydroanticapsin 7-dehydrogenase n=1 Tax=Thermogymnomonas acidicola TaxID=399579 RepID=A0AA37BSC3_9ARCH|nr:SDR family oxidoreductase [Thermogymnomonas acidicola]GGM74522.1 dihydroanticapsin 7-dehydrogenase [Thermogymnomonas acidicola]